MPTNITTSEAAAVENGVQSIGATFGGIGSLMSSNWLFASLMTIAVIGSGIAIFRKIVRKFSSGGRRS